MAAVCGSCQTPLVIAIDSSDDDEELGMPMEEGSGSAAQAEETVPDDVHLRCGCHLHWQCLLDSYSMTTCPCCSADLTSQSPTGQHQILCDLHNEGGFQEDLDILPLLTEESYLKAYPEERKARAFLEFCRNGDVPAIVEILQNPEDYSDEEDADEPTIPQENQIDILRYQDPIGDMQSGLHAAVRGKSREVVWLLLLLASELDLQRFPAIVFQEAGVMEIMRGDIAGKTDIRSLRDAQGRSAEQLATEVGGPWADWLGQNLLTV